MSFIKSEPQQVKDKAAIKKEVKAKYLAELEEAKQSWVKTITADLASKTEAQAALKAQNKTVQLQGELLAMLSK